MDFKPLGWCKHLFSRLEASFERRVINRCYYLIADLNKTCFKWFRLSISVISKNKQRFKTWYRWVYKNLTAGVAQGRLPRCSFVLRVNKSSCDNESGKGQCIIIYLSAISVGWPDVALFTRQASAHSSPTFLLTKTSTSTYIGQLHCNRGKWKPIWLTDNINQQKKKTLKINENNFPPMHNAKKS